jgi:hypothetical protein
MSNLVKPTLAVMADPEQAQKAMLRLYEAVVALQAAAVSSSPERSGRAAGTAEIVVIRGATVTLPGSAVTFTADVYAWGVRT